MQTFVTNEVLRRSDDYVPFDIVNRSGHSGLLRSTGHIEGTDVVWHTPYARRLYYHPEYNFQGAPTRGGNWVDRMLQNGGMIEIEKGARKVASK